MRCVGLETCTRALSVALAEDEEILLDVRDRDEHPRAHGIWKKFLEACRDAGYGLEEIDCVAVGTGPGRFTGIRAGVALGMGLRIALDCPMRGASSLDVLAYSVGDRASSGETVVAYLPRPGSDSYYARSYIWGKDGPIPQNDIEWLKEEALELLGRRSTWTVGPDASRKTDSGAVTAWPRAAELVRWVTSDVSRPWQVFPLNYMMAPKVHPSDKGDS